MSAPRIAECGAMSNFSFLEGASHPHELAAAAKALGHAALGIADRNTTAGLVRGMLAAEEAGLRFLPGCRVTLTDGCEYLVWPSDRAAWGRLTRLLSEANLASPPGECHVTRDALLAAAEGQAMALVAPDAPDARFAERLARDSAALRRALVLPLFCAVAHRFAGDDRKRLDRLAAMSAAAGARLLAAGGVRFHAPERRRMADVLTAIRLKRTVDTLGDQALANAEAHLKPPEELLRLFAGHTEAVTACGEILDACRFSLRDLRYDYPREILEPGRSAQQTLEARVAEACAERWPDGVPERVAKQIAHELELISRKGYAPYFLTVHEIVRFARSRGILCQGRGSAANSAVCYALGITAVAPDKHDLLFERFISDARDEPPDIDVDFEHERREEVIQHIYERYGRDRAAICATLIRYRERSAIREVGKALGLSDDITAGLAKGVWAPRGERSLDAAAADRGLDPSADPRLGLALELAEDIQDFPRHLATHVGGFVITDRPLLDLAVVRRAAMEDRTTLEWDKDDIEALGMMKVDVLGLGMLSCLRRCFDLLAHHTGRRMGLAEVPQDDPATYAMLRRGDSLGVFQVESRAQMNMLPRLKPRCFYDLVIEVAIVRPGPIQGDMVHPYLRRRNGLEPVTYASPAMERVLQRTLGVPLFQEQAMRIAIEGAGFSPARADQLRRAMATFRARGNLDAFEAEFLDGMVKHGHDFEFARRCFNQIQGFGTYGFPESHAASFALLVYVSAWLKCHHPAAFAAALINSQPMGFYAPAQILRDLREHGVRVRAVDVNHSAHDCTLEPDEGSRGGFALRLGLRLVSGLPEQAAKAVAAAAPFRDVADLIRRAGLDRGAMERLAQADALASLGLDRRGALWAASGVAAPAPLAADAREPPARLPRATEGEEVVLDHAATGLSLRAHPLALLRPRLTALGLADSRALAAAPRGRWLRLPGLVLVRQRPGSAKGVVFFTIEDEFGVANLVLYPDIAERFRAAVVGARLVVAEGRAERVEDAEVPILHLIVRRLFDRSDLLDGLHLLDGRGLNPTLSRADEVNRPTRDQRRRPACHPPEPSLFAGSRDWR
jgi:error-prone DNA polymerase